MSIVSRPRAERASPTREPARSRRVNWASWVSTALVVLAWYLAAVTGLLDPRTLPGPDRVLVAGWESILDGTLPEAVAVSSGRVLAGAAIGVLLGVVLGAFAGLSRVGENVVDKPMQMLRTIPFTALVPLFILWFGIGELPKVLLVAFGTAIPVYVNTYGGIRNVDVKLVEAARVAGVTGTRIATKVLIPAALPTLLLGLRFALGLGWIAVIVSETIGADSGIGYLMAQARQFVRTDVMLVCLCLYALLGLLTDFVVRGLERRLLAWRGTYLG
ncbi:ABC transporter permease [Prauserella cavernicola]|uniref:ABC transporter permease n=1 Tax=Prauserella cavernicola TaxID=2800127 RepID=A0A934QQ72_9PSEU|nr:ABC transporter permease [Prauserella cavernicola]MBK1783709.1 ABC transporter permease [Prauserella cavernicola]